ncbi:recombinase family protein [Catenuloplanes sp. NPDC051500]|uniref:recombinase family protein n=1 Tax=Catenuloplanes sp. NPDC051500 TaxID=3363959 RepID=UPI00379B5543
MNFGFYGRVSTEDQQDPAASRGWQLSRAKTLIAPADGQIVREFFDIGLSRSIPWKRRPEATALLTALKDPHRGFDAIVIGEPQRAFYGNQYGLTFPLFVHYGVQLWVPEVGGAIDPDSEAHDLVMSVFGGMSKGERTRIRIRVRAAMATQAVMEGRFLGGRPPYGYHIVELGPHPNPGKAAIGQRLHGLDIDEQAAPVVARIFAEYIAGAGIYAIAQGLTHDEIPSPSAHDRERNRHRSGIAWSKGAVRAILLNPRYTGYQVWNRQRKQEVLIDVDDVALGHETKMRWNDEEAWLRSSTPSHPAIVTAETFQLAQDVLGASKRGKQRLPRATTRPYQLRGLLYCGLCDRRMQGMFNHSLPHYRCRYPNEYALANHVEHPLTVYLRENRVIPALDRWLAKIFQPGRIEDTITTLADAQPENHTESTAELRAIADCDRKIASYRATLDAGGDPTIISEWIAQTQTEKKVAESKLRQRDGKNKRLTREQIHHIVTTLTDITQVIHDANPADKAEIYSKLGLRLTYHPGKAAVLVEARPGLVCTKYVSEGGHQTSPRANMPWMSGRTPSCTIWRHRLQESISMPQRVAGAPPPANPILYRRLTPGGSLLRRQNPSKKIHTKAEVHIRISII